MNILETPKFATHVDGLLTEHHVPGVAIAVYENGTFASAGFGLASLESSKPCTPDTLFDIASSSKSITAASVALLVDDKEAHPNVTWDAIMSELLPGDFVLEDDVSTKSVTLDDIIGHRSGMPRHDFSYLGPKAEHPDDSRSMTRNLRNLPLAAPIRTKYMYCNIMYTVASYLVEQKSGQPFADFVQKHFFGPLKMDSTNLQPNRARAKDLGDRIATGYEWDDAKEEYISFPYADDPAGIGAGSIVTSVNDYVKYVVALMNQEPPFTKEMYEGLIRPRIIQEPEAKKLAPNTSMSGYAAGWQTYWYRGHRVVMHDGAIFGSGTVHFFVPEIKFAGAIFGNAGDATVVTMVLSHELIDEALKVPEEERPDWNAFETDFQDEDDKDEEGNKLDPVEKLRQEICPGIGNEEKPQTTPLPDYTGKYFNAGYHTMEVQIKDGKLFIDAKDRTFPASLTFEHVCEQTQYIAHMSDLTSGTEDEHLKASFEFKDGKPLRMAIQLEEETDSYDGYIWFDKV